MQFDELVAYFVQNDQFSKTNGAVLTILSPGHVSYRLTIKETHQSSPGTCHGGVIAGLMDAVLGASALTQAFIDQKLVSTVEFKINFLRPVAVGETLYGEGRVEHAGTRLITTGAKILLADTDTVIALGLGTFNLYPLEKKQQIKPLL